jgi:hypothetical protein
MKKLFLFIAILFPILCYSQNETTSCTIDTSVTNSELIPNYLQSWWGQVRIGNFAVIYIDFPDGRYIKWQRHSSAIL